MRKSTFSYLLLCACVFAVALQSCRNDSYLLTAPAVPNQSFTEEFDTVSSALNRGWVVKNASDPLGSNIWQQGGAITPWFPAFSSKGSYVGFIGADYTSTSADAGIISNWLISPVVTMQNGDKISFYTRAFLDPAVGTDSTDYANRMQVRVNTLNDSTNVGSGYDVGDFTNILLDINPSYIEHHTDPLEYSPYAYPARWTRFEVTIVGINKPVRGRFAFRYFIEGGGFNGLGSGVAIDQVHYESVKH
jgi:hypothetical protein